MEEKIVRVHVEGMDDGYAVVYAANGCLTSVEVASEALDVAALTALAVDAAEGYATPQEARQHGEELYAFLVGERPWARSVAEDLAQSGHTHVCLDIRSALLRSVPWELAYQDGYLALMPRVRISRAGCARLATRSTQSPARVIVLVPDLADEMTDREAEMVFEALGSAQRGGLVVARQVSYELSTLPARLGGCDILHISGRTDELAAHMDWLVAVCQQAAPLLVCCSGLAGGSRPGNALGDGVSRGESPAESQIDLAAALQREAGVSVVIGLRGIASSSSSSLLAAEFYRGLAGGLATPAAVARARRQLALALDDAPVGERVLDWAGMVLYQNDEQGLVLTELGLVAPEDAPGVVVMGEGDPGQLSARMMRIGIRDPFGAYSARNSGRQRGMARKRMLGRIVGATDQDPTALVSSLAKALGESGSQDESEEAMLDRLRACLGAHAVEGRTLELLQGALRSDDRRRQVAATEALGLIGSGQPAARDILVGLVVGPESGPVAPIVRQTAIEQLGHIGDPPTVEALLLAMVDPEQEIRDLARRALADASRAAGAVSGRAGAKLPLQSDEATKWIAPLRQAIASDKDLSPRQRVDRMAQVEALRLELIRPRFRPERIRALLGNLEGASPETMSLVLDLRRQIEWGVPSAGSPAMPVPESRPGRGGAR